MIVPVPFRIVWTMDILLGHFLTDKHTTLSQFQFNDKTVRYFSNYFMKKFNLKP